MSSDYQLESTIYLPFTTRAFATGIPTALVSGAIDIYEDVTATPIITGETLAVSLNSVAGFNMITVTATSGTGFGAGQSYTAILQAGTVDGVSVVGEVVAHFTLDMSAAAKDLANGTDGLGAIKAETANIEADTQDIQTRLPAALDGGFMTSHVNVILAGAIDAAAIATDAIDADALAADAVDEIWDEAMTETTGAPAVTASFREAFKWMFALSRNKITQTATTTTLRNDADGADLATSTVSDDATTYTRGEWST